MVKSIYRATQLQPRSFFQKIFKQYPEENAVHELNNLLATKPILSIEKGEIDAINKKYGLHLETEFKLNLEEFYAVYLNYCLKDESLNSNELIELQHLKTILNLDDSTVRKLHLEIGEIVYRKACSKAIANGYISPEEETHLSNIQSELNLPKVLVDKVSIETKKSFIKKYIANIIRNEHFSPDVENELNAVSTNLNIKVQLENEITQQLQKLKLYWALENFALPTFQSNIELQKGECCFISIRKVDWNEFRSTRYSTSLDKHSTGFKSIKSFYVHTSRTNQINPSPYEIKSIDSGNLYLTNKRILFSGLKKNSIVRLDKIKQVVPFTNGLAVVKEAGTTPYIALSERADVFCLILNRLLKEQIFNK